MLSWNKLNIDSNSYFLGAITTNANPTVLTLDQSPVNGPLNQIMVPAGTGMSFEAEIIGLAGPTVFRQIVKGVIKSALGTTTLVGSNITTDKWNDSAAGTWSATVTADNVNKCLAVTVTGGAAVNINWFALISTLEVT